MSAERPWPVGTRVIRKSDGQLAVVFDSPIYGYGLRYEDYDYCGNPDDMHDFCPSGWEPVDPKDRPVKGICKFLRKYEVSS